MMRRHVVRSCPETTPASRGPPQPESSVSRAAETLQRYRKAWLHQAQSRSMPVFELPDANGETMRSANLQGKVVVVRFWATW